MIDVDKLRGLIDESTLLSDEERVYWHDNLAFMNDAQLERLYKILDGAEKVSLSTQMQRFFNAFATATKTLAS